MSNAAKAHIALFVAQVIYALNYSIAKGLMPDYIGPLALVLIRIAGSLPLFWIASIFMKTQKVAKEDLKKMMWLAIFGVVINQVFFIYGLSLTHPINSAIIMISNPIIVFIFTLVLLKERITLLKVGGLTSAILGAIILLLFKGNFEVGSDTITGDLMTLINSTSWAIFLVMVKPVMQKYNTVTAMRWMFLFGTIYMLPIGLHDLVQTDFMKFTAHQAWAVVFVVVATTFLAYFLNVYGLAGLNPTVASMYIYMQPFLASIFAIAAGQDQLTSTKIFSGILIILGLYMVNYKPKRLKT